MRTGGWQVRVQEVLAFARMTCRLVRVWEIPARRPEFEFYKRCVIDLKELLKHSDPGEGRDLPISPKRFVIPAKAGTSYQYLDRITVSIYMGVQHIFRLRIIA